MVPGVVLRTTSGDVWADVEERELWARVGLR
jgi:hypothetical protein